MGNAPSSPHRGGSQKSSSTTRGGKSSTMPGAAGDASVHSRLSSSPDLRHTITLRERDADPFKVYEALEVIGFGSMGSITRVRKRADAAGGSARPKNVDPCAVCLDESALGRLFRPLIRATRNKCDAVVPVPPAVSKCGMWGATGQQDSTSTAAAASTRAASGAGSVSKAAGRSGAGKRTETAVDVDNHSSGRVGQKNFARAMFESLSEVMQSSLSLGPDPYEPVHYALKSIHLNRVRNKEFLDELRNEVAILRTLDHPYIVKAIETFGHRSQLYLVLELCTGGDLYTRDPYTEEEAARITRMVLSAVSYMHERNIVHRDLKYENIMFANPTPQSEVKIIDFGLSKKFGPDESLREGVGTIYTMAPQVLEGNYTSACDLWSVGVITYALLSSQVPFFANKRRVLIEKIKKGKFDFKGRRWKYVTQQAKDFVSDLLQVDPEVRPTADEARKSLWLNRTFTQTVRVSDEMEGDVSASIYNFSNYSQLQKLALMIVAHKSSSDEIGFLRKAFEKYEKGAGVISKSEFQTCLVDYGYSTEELDRMFEAVDIGSTGYIEYTEFLAATIEVHGAINEERLAEAFDRLDSDDSGYISLHNLRSILGNEIPQADLDRIIEEADCDDDKKISYDEFLALWDVDQERQRDNALQSVKARMHKSSSIGLSALMTNSEMSHGNSSAPSQAGLSVASSDYSGRSTARDPPGSAGSNLPAMMSPSTQPTEAPVDPGDVPT